VTTSEEFSSQSDAETWLGVEWRALLAGGVIGVTLYEGTRQVGPRMSLEPLD
jgi:hypothetical protein